MKKFIAILATSAMLVSATSAFAADYYTADFENDTVDALADGDTTVDGWTISGTEHAAIVSDPYDAESTNKALKLQGKTSTNSAYRSFGGAAQTSVTPAGENDGLVDVTLRYSWDTSSQLGHGIRLKDSTAAGDGHGGFTNPGAPWEHSSNKGIIAELGVVGLNSGSITRNGYPLAGNVQSYFATSLAEAAGGGKRRIDSTNYELGMVWGNSSDSSMYDIMSFNPLANNIGWGYVRVVLDFDNQVYNAYLATVPVTDDMILNPASYLNRGMLGFTVGFPFADTSVTKLDAIQAFISYGSGVVTYVDDVNVKDYTGPTLPEYSDATIVPYGPNGGVSADRDYNGTGTGAIRFSNQIVGDGVTSAGACVVPVSIFNDGLSDVSFKAATSSVKKVTVKPMDADHNDVHLNNTDDHSFISGETYGVDVLNIPADQFDTQLIAKPFAVVRGRIEWSTTNQIGSVNSAAANAE